MRKFLGVFLRVLWFILVWAVLALGSACVLLSNEIWLFMQWWYYCLLGLFAWLFAFGHLAEAEGQKSRTGVVGLHELSDLVVLSEPQEGELLRFATMRQSGNEQAVKLLDSKKDALREVVKTFNRKGVDKVRIWKNTSKHLDVRITYYHGRGRKEGKVIRGVDLRRVRA